MLNAGQNGPRKASGDHLSTPLRSDSLQANGVTPSPNAGSPNSATSENSPAPWSSAIGHATTTGKSGRVIERLMTENDKLKRDLNAQIIKAQELEKSLQTYKPQIEALRQENDNLNHARGVDSGLISRRDRKIEELKAELLGERQRRERAEELARERQKEKDDMEEQGRREAQRLTESERQATETASIFQTTHKQLRAEYNARTESLRTDILALHDSREQDRQKLAKMDVVLEQMRQEYEKVRRVNGEMLEGYERLKEDSKAQIREAEQEVHRENERSRMLSAEMGRVVDEMRWVMAVKRNVKGADVDHGRSGAS